VRILLDKAANPKLPCRFAARSAVECVLVDGGSRVFHVTGFHIQPDTGVQSYLVFKRRQIGPQIASLDRRNAQTAKRSAQSYEHGPLGKDFSPVSLYIRVAAYLRKRPHVRAEIARDAPVPQISRKQRGGRWRDAHMRWNHAHGRRGRAAAHNRRGKKNAHNRSTEAANCQFGPCRDLSTV
jgi:hypothetical protein